MLMEYLVLLSLHYKGHLCTICGTMKQDYFGETIWQRVPRPYKCFYDLSHRFTLESVFQENDHKNFFYYFYLEL